MKIKFTWNNVLLAFCFILAIVPLICLVGPGYSASGTIEGISMEVNDSLAGFMAGDHTLKGEVCSGICVESTTYFDGCVSIFGLISLIVLLASIAIEGIAAYKGNKTLKVIGAICFIVSGIFMFLLLTVGTKSTHRPMPDGSVMPNVSFKDMYKDEAGLHGGLGAGAICYALFAILTGIGFLINALLKQDYLINKNK